MPKAKSTKVKTSKYSKKNKIVLLIVVLLVAIGGAAYLVSSKADSLTGSVTINPNSINLGQSTTVSIISQGTMICTWAKGEGLAGQTVYNPQVSHSFTVTPSRTQAYEALCKNTITGQGISVGATVNVDSRPKGYISISPVSVNKGGSITVGIRADNAMYCTWSKGDGLAGTTTYNVNVWQYKTVVPSATQSYEAWCVNSVTGEGAAANPNPATVTVITIPTAPTITSISSTKTPSVSLRWAASTDPEGIRTYNIYRSDSNRPVQVNAISYTDKNVVRKRTYTYQISAVDNTGVEGPKSAPKSIYIY